MVVINGYRSTTAVMAIMDMDDNQRSDRLQMIAAIIGFVLIVTTFIAHRPRLMAWLGVGAFGALMLSAMWWFR